MKVHLKFKNLRYAMNVVEFLYKLHPYVLKDALDLKRSLGSILGFKVLLRRKFLFLFPSFFNINLLFMFKIIQIAKNWNATCVRGLEISH